MKFTILFFFSLLITNNLCAQKKRDTLYLEDTLKIISYNKIHQIKIEEYSINQIVIKQKYWNYFKSGFSEYTIYSSQPKTTDIKEYYLDGKIKIIGKLYKNKKEGKYLTYYNNGNAQCICNYKGGKRDSMQTRFYENGNLSFKGNYVNGKQEGLFNYYHSNGLKWQQIEYIDGKASEVVFNFDSKGKEREKGTLNDGNGTVYIYNEDDTLKEIEHYKNGKLKKTIKIRVQ